MKIGPISELIKTTPSKLPTFSGNTSGFGPFLPGMSAGDFGSPGIAPLIDLDNGAPLPFDPFNLHAEGLLEGASIMIIGARGFGKTTAGITFATYWGARNAAGRPMHIAADIIRRDDGVAELAKFVRKLDSEPIPLINYELNILDTQLLTRSQALGMLEETLEFIWKRSMPIDVYNGLAAGMRRMYMEDFRIDGCPSLLVEILGKMDREDIRAHHPEATAVLDEKAKTNPAIAKLRERNRPESALDDTVNGAHEAAKWVNRLMELGSIGDKHSLAQDMQQRVFAPEYTGLTDEEIVVIQKYIWRVKTLAHMNNDPRFSFNVELNDENYKLCRYLSYVKGQSDHLKALRGTRSVSVMMVHRFADYETVGMAGSQERELATNMIADQAAFLIARQPRSAIQSLITHAELSKNEAEMATHLGKHEWILKVRGQDIRRVGLNVTSGILDVSYSTSSADQMYIPTDEEE